jgi:hypothetical protein
MIALLKETGETILLPAVEDQEAICLENMEPLIICDSINYLREI